MIANKKKIIGVTSTPQNSNKTNKLQMKLCKLLHYNSLYFKGFSWGAFILISATALSMIITTWPQHDIILFPEYWYEPLPPLIIGCVVFSTALSFVGCNILLKPWIVLSWKVLLRMCLILALGVSIVYLSINILWIFVLGYKPPMPFILLCTFTVYATMRPAVIWYIFPPNLRVFDLAFIKQLIALIFLTWLVAPMGIGYNKMRSLLNVVPPNYQWCLALLYTLVRKFNVWWYTELTKKASGGNKNIARRVAICAIGCMYAISITILLGSNITLTTACLFIVCDCIINTCSCVKILKNHRQGIYIVSSEQSEALKCLALKEFLELIIPVIYSASFLIAFYGPNGEIIGGVNSEYWNHKPVESLSKKFEKIGMFFAIDFIRAISFGLVLWRFCRLNLIKSYCLIIQKYGILIMLNIVANQAGVRYTII